MEEQQLHLPTRNITPFSVIMPVTNSFGTVFSVDEFWAENNKNIFFSSTEVY